MAYWTTRTGTGLIFGSGLVVSFIVGIMVLYQTLATQITRQLPQFATLKAIGYTNRYLDGDRPDRGVPDDGGRFLPALAAALGIYAVVRAADPAAAGDDAPARRCSPSRCIMAATSAFLSLARLRRAEPAEIF